MWGYYWGHTAAQIELMAIDVPIVVYDHSDDKKKKKPKKASTLDIIRANKEWNEKYGDMKEGEKVKLDIGKFLPQNTEQ